MRFLMQPEFTPQPGADGWQVSNPPIFSLVPVRMSLALFAAAKMPRLRAKSEQLTSYLHYLLDQLPRGRYEVITPREPNERGCQLSLLVQDRPRELMRVLTAAGVICDFREPNVIRVAPVPLYNSFQEVWRFARILAGHV
jgi:kynureninase